MTVVDWIAERLDTAGVVTFLAGALVLAVLQLIGRLAIGARRRLGEREAWYERLERLRTDVARAYFEQELGLRHAFSNRVSGRFTEYIYPHKWFHVQAFTNVDDDVIMYSVTTRDENFTPRVWPTSASPESYPALPRFRLGNVTFAEVFPEVRPHGIRAFFSGATAPSLYEESFSLGNPGLYLTYLIGLNAAGHHFFAFSDVYSEQLFGPKVAFGRLAGSRTASRDIEAFLSQEHISRFRSVARPNVYGIVGQKFSGDELPVYLGPDRTQVRTL